jgi:hypothetical protein
MVVLHLGGYAEAARVLTEQTGRPITRQAVQQMWKRRTLNHFPDRRPYNINGHIRLLFNMAEVVEWRQQQMITER